MCVCVCVCACVCTKIRLTSTMPAMYLVSVKKPPLINGVKRLLGRTKESETGIRKDCYLLPVCVCQYFRDSYLKLGTVKNSTR